MFGALVWTLPENQTRYPAFVLAPQSDVNWPCTLYDPNNPPKTVAEIKWCPPEELGTGARLAFEIIDDLLARLPIDQARIYVTGHSMGGAGTWHMIAHRPRFFAAAVPVCGHPVPSTAPAVKDVPIWNFHGPADEIEPVATSRVMIEALRKAGGTPRHTRFTPASATRCTGGPTPSPRWSTGCSRRKGSLRSQVAGTSRPPQPNIDMRRLRGLRKRGFHRSRTGCEAGCRRVVPGGHGCRTVDRSDPRRRTAEAGLGRRGAAFSELFRRRHPDVFRFALHMTGSVETAEDVVQDVFMVVMRDGARYETGRATVAAWLCGIARNCVRQRLDRDRRLTAVDFGDDREPGPGEIAPTDPLADLLRAERIDALRLAVQTLPLPYREAVVLCDLQELSYGDAAEAIGCPVGTVRSRLHRARTMLAAKLSVSGLSAAATETASRPASGGRRRRMERSHESGESGRDRVRVRRMNCNELEADVVDLARGAELSEGAAARVREHLGGCVACTARFAREQQLTGGLKAIADSAPVSARAAAIEAELLRAFADRQAAASRPSPAPFGARGSGNAGVACGRGRPGAGSGRLAGNHAVEAG